MKNPLIIGLTGSIGMGKSTAARILRGLGLAVFDADERVHELLGRGGRAVGPVARKFPSVLRGASIDRQALGALVFASPQKRRQLERIIHPLLKKEIGVAIRQAQRAKEEALVLDLPLLFETKTDRQCDVTLCVTAPARVQRRRVMQRPHMTPALFRAILAQQMPDGEKRRRADVVIRTGKGYADTKRQLAVFWERMKKNRDA